MQPLVHPLAPRFSQAITGVLALEAAIFGQPVALGVALALVLLSLAGPRWSPVAWVFRRIAPPAAELEPARPVRFSQTLAAVFLTTALVLIAVGWDVAGWAVALAVSAVAVISAITGFCIGCEVYRLLLARRGGAPEDVRDDLGLTGSGPWLVVLTAPGCARCEPLAREMERAAGDREVVRVDLSRRPAAAALPVRSVPAALAIGPDGSLRAARAGKVGAPEIAQVLAAL